MTFELKTPTSVSLENVSTRIEHHGDAHVLAADLKVLLTTNNTTLDLFHPKLREALFCSLASDAAKAAGQTEMELPVSDLPNMTFPMIDYPIKWDLELSGFVARVDYGLGGDADIVLNQCTLKKFKFSAIEGGSVAIEFTISSSADIDERIAGKLSVMQQQAIYITLLAPALVEGDVIDVTAGSGAPGTGPALEAPKDSKPKSKAHRDATAAFLDAQAPLTH